MKKRVFCLFMCLVVVVGCIFTFGGEYKGDIRAAKSQVEVMKEKVNEEEVIQVETVSFEYPITPDDPEWKELGSVQNKIEACRIPVEILSKMTDEQLVQAIMDFPFLIDLFAASSEEAGVNSLEKICDAYRELLTRSSAKTVLLDKVEQQLSIRTGNVNAEQMILNDALVILVLYQDEFKGKLTSEELNSLAELSSQIEISDESQSGAQAYAVSEPRTPSGASVSYLIFTCDHGPLLYHEAIDQGLLDTYNIQLISHGSCKYNCHSYAWHSRLATNIYWINNPALYMLDPSYSLVLSGLNTSSLSAGKDDIVFYGYTDDERIENSHSAVLISGGTGEPLATRYVYSKWGRAGVFKHIVATVPNSYDTSRMTVWSR